MSISPKEVEDYLNKFEWTCHKYSWIEENMRSESLGLIQDQDQDRHVTTGLAWGFSPRKKSVV